MKKQKRQKFKTYEMNQAVLLPQDIGERISERHMVRVVNHCIDQMDLQELEDSYKGGGTTSYNPRMLLKVLVYAYIEKNYSGRQIAKAIRENLPYMWISGGNEPDFRTLNRFRSERLRGQMQSIFREVLIWLHEAGYVKQEHYFLDGTKIEADANRYGFQWKKSIRNNRRKLEKKVKELFSQIEEINTAEDAEYGDKDLEELGEDIQVSSSDLEELVSRLNEIVSKDEENKAAKAALKKVKTEFHPRLKRYEEAEARMGERNSCSKTDGDATFMQMKEDHMRNRSLKLGYNVQMGTEDQFILGYSIHQTSSDSPTLSAHMAQLKRNRLPLPKVWVADAGYGSEENYALLETEQIEAHVKYPRFDRENKKWRKLTEKEPYLNSAFSDDAGKDQYICPQGQVLYFERLKEDKTATGFLSEKRLYRCSNCDDCPVKGLCTRSEHGRSLEVSQKLERYRKEVFDRLRTPEGERLRKKRSTDVEPVFGMIKGNKKFRRFHLRGLEKVEIEWGFVSLAHNLTKVAIR